MTTIEPPNLSRHLWKSVLLTGVLTLILGVLVLAWPGISILVAAILFGLYLLITGVTEVFFAFSLHVSASNRVLLFIGGALSLVLAVLAFRHPGDAILLLAIWVAVGFIFRGVAETTSAISDPSLPGRGWHIALGIIALIAGVMVLAWPFASIVTLTVVTGCWLVVIGAFEIASAFGIRRGASPREPHVTS